MIALLASILVARHLKNENELLTYRASPRTENLIASAIQIAERIVTRVERG
jgi:hypothetical protein